MAFVEFRKVQAQLVFSLWLRSGINIGAEKERAYVVLHVDCRRTMANNRPEEIRNGHEPIFAMNFVATAIDFFYVRSTDREKQLLSFCLACDPNYLQIITLSSRIPIRV